MKPFVTPYNFAVNNPISYIDPDGKDEIHFYYTLTQNLDGNGKGYTTVTISPVIIKDGKEQLTFYMGKNNLFSKEIQFTPFVDNMRIANSNSYKAFYGGLPFTKESWLYGTYTSAIDDYSYLGILLNSSPEVLERYRGTVWENFLKGAQDTEASRELSSSLRKGVEVTYAVIDGYYLLKGAANLTSALLLKNAGAIDAEAAAILTRQAKNADDVLDCTDISFSMGNTIEGGTVYKMTSKSEKWMNGIEYGEKEKWTFHQFFEKNGYVYDPMYSENPVKTKQYIEHYQKMNPEGIFLEEQ